ncbi:MAG: invasion associated locus B family protein [Alphaproteobacteria bacterium]|nr:invasion associated locus B family protein [Alphaproteobacteria bacterium]MDE2111227.1 invasion associated locus B family protein [Alphaproteobacteria bacterium]MDE2492597.1 invasion associated locus B family protein [Alphaproteobacteria bacterium]
MSETSSSVLTRMGAAFGSMPPALWRLLLVLAVFLVGGIAGWIGRGVLAGPADVPTMSVYEDWHLLCPALKTKDGACEISQDVYEQRAGERLARIILAKEKDKSMVMYVTVPLQVLLEPGIGLKLGNDQVRVYQYKTCTEEGCLAVIPVDDQLLASLTKAQDAGIDVAQPNGKAAELPFSMKGYADAYGAFLNNEAKRKSWWRRLWS